MIPFCVMCRVTVVSYCHGIEKLKFAKIITPRVFKKHPPWNSLETLGDSLGEVSGQIHHDALSGPRDSEILLHIPSNTCVPHYQRWVPPLEVPSFKPGTEGTQALGINFKRCKASEWILKSSILLAV